MNVYTCICTQQVFRVAARKKLNSRPIIRLNMLSTGNLFTDLSVLSWWRSKRMFNDCFENIVYSIGVLGARIPLP